MIAERIRVRGTVQGVGFRPAVWRIARDLGLRGHVANDTEGVLIEVWGASDDLDRFVRRMRDEAPPLARIGSVERLAREPGDAPPAFRIETSDPSASTQRAPVAADAGICADCRAEILDPSSRRYRYAFTNCTQCGPRLSIVRGVPYDRERTTMAAFAMCEDCAREYHDPSDRRFHAQPIACPRCGPRLSLRKSSGDEIVCADVLATAATLIAEGAIVAIEGLGGYQLACDATNPGAVARLRARKHRERKPFALMARDLEMIRRHCAVSAEEAALLSSVAAPIVLLDRTSPAGFADAVAPELTSLGFMLPAAPLHALLLESMEHPIVLTSGNRSDEPQAIDRIDAHERLASIADYFVEHDRPIARRVDDSVVRVAAGYARVVRRARGYAPEAIPLPAGFERTPQVLAFGGELKNTFCMLRRGEAILSPHIGDLGQARARADYERALAELRELHAFAPEVLACDRHPDYASTQLATREARDSGTLLIAAQHHHAHIAACLAENGVPRDAAPVLGVALDGIGYGDDGTLWGGEVLLADYAGCTRLGHVKPVAMPGGEAAIREPWRNTYAHLVAAGLSTALLQSVDAKARAVIDRMLERGVNAPLASSCGRLFDAVAAAMGVARDHAYYEGQGAVELEALVHRSIDDAYPFELTSNNIIEPRPMWEALLEDLTSRVPAGVIAARFHNGVADAVVALIERFTDRSRTVALSGGVFQNRVLLERLTRLLDGRGHRVLTHRRVPCNDGGLSLGQAVIAAARSMEN
ncbi:MAG TPA: carbamoyltransferase HypF [Nevskiaceae bacterium]|nr:carbamoyltransferase HypF [Nevskiaceae bacterium]